LVKQSIEKYRRGNKEQKETAEILQNIYDKIKEADSSSEIENSFDQVNKDAVLSWQNEWAKVYPTLAQISYNIYNQILGNDVNYTPDKFSVFEADVEVDLDNESGSEEHTSELQSRLHLVCRLLLEKKKTHKLE